MEPVDLNHIYKQQFNKSYSINSQLIQVLSPVSMNTQMQRNIGLQNEVVHNGISMVDVIGGDNKSEVIIIPMSKIIQNASSNGSNVEDKVNKQQDIMQKQQIQMKKGSSFYEKKQPQIVKTSGFSLHKTPDQSNNKRNTNINVKVQSPASSSRSQICFFQNNKSSNKSSERYSAVDNYQHVSNYNENTSNNHKGYISLGNISPISKKKHILNEQQQTSSPKFQQQSHNNLEKISSSSSVSCRVQTPLRNARNPQKVQGSLQTNEKSNRIAQRSFMLDGKSTGRGNNSNNRNNNSTSTSSLKLIPSSRKKQSQETGRSKLSNSISNLFTQTQKLKCYQKDNKNNNPRNYQQKKENKQNFRQIDSNGCLNSNDNSFLNRSLGIQPQSIIKVQPYFDFFNSTSKNKYIIHSSYQTASVESPSYSINKENSNILGNQQSKQESYSIITRKDDSMFTSSPPINTLNKFKSNVDKIKNQSSNSSYNGAYLSSKQVVLAQPNFFSKFTKNEDRYRRNNQLENGINISVDQTVNKSYSNSQLQEEQEDTWLQMQKKPNEQCLYPLSPLLASSNYFQYDPIHKQKPYMSFASQTTVATSQQSNFRFSESNQGQENMKFDQASAANEECNQPVAYSYVCKVQKSFLYDQIIPTIKPIFNQTKIQSWKNNNNNINNNGQQDLQKEIDNFFEGNKYQTHNFIKKDQASEELLNTPQVLLKSAIMKMTNFQDCVEDNFDNNKLFIKSVNKDQFKKTLLSNYNHQASEQYQLSPFVSENQEELRTQQHDNFSFSNFINQQKDSLDYNKQQQDQERRIINGDVKYPQEITNKNNQAHNIIESFSQMQNQQVSESSEIQKNQVIQEQIENQMKINGISWVSSSQILELEDQESNDMSIQFTQCISNKRLNQSMWCLEQFEIGRSLGKGRFGNVYLARHKPSNMFVAIKQIHIKRLRDSQMEQQLEQEIKIQSFCNHPNILKMYGFFQEDSQIHLILELALHGDIYKEKKQQKQQWFSEKKGAEYIRQICEGLMYLHSQGIIHRDIKPENILNSYGVLKISDFGWSVFSKEKRSTFCGTLDYVSPEVISGDLYDSKVDVWSIGVMTYELLTGKPPFENKDIDLDEDYSKAYSKILKVNYEFPIYVSQSARQFVSSLLTSDPSQRISLEEALNHPWIRSNTYNILAEWDSSVSEQILSLLS